MASAAASGLPAELIGAVGGWLRSREPMQVCGSLDACQGRGLPYAMVEAGEIVWHG